MVPTWKAVCFNLVSISSFFPPLSAFSTLRMSPQHLSDKVFRAESRTASTVSSSISSSASDDEDSITILGFGSLLSEKSSRLTFPDLKNFRLVRVPNHRRVFAHPASIFFQRNIANPLTLEMSSLSVEPAPNSSFLAAAFEVSRDEMVDGVPSPAFLEREEEFDIVQVAFMEYGSNETDQQGVICLRSSDQAYIDRWGPERFETNFRLYGVETIWNWPPESGLRPCGVYLRHCYLAAKSMGEECVDSFLDDTYLVDRSSTIREYLRKHPHILDLEPPDELKSRYSG